ncbi:MAG TPA: mycofactocin biosynthesis peptidyl-dipeptidase MftE [Acidimicrobiales bacterium]|jgi:creatinine amidohydrolase|nr:mycofactocin biosynthesis peptidyl-dipeptidase MftE [Acidimicrobiales bacterium]
MNGDRDGSDLSRLPWPAVGELADAGALLAVPVGSTEQHGPHLPLSTDTDLAVALCARLAATRTDVLVAPALPYGASGEHDGFAGTLSIGQEVLEAVLVELGRSALGRFAGMVLVSAHGGNAEPVARAGGRLVAESRRVLAWSPRWDGDAHAGWVETSLQLALAPELVHLDRATAGDTRPLVELLPALRSGGVAAVSPSGVLGDPAGASADRGLALLDQLAADLARAVAGWRQGWPCGPGSPR